MNHPRAASRHTDPPSGEPHTWHVLVVDDDEAEFRLTSAMLAESRRAKFVITLAATYQQGLELLTSQSFDAALINYRLSGLQGIDLIAEAGRHGCATPLLLITGQGSYEVDMLAMAAGASDYLNKNETTPAMLERAIRYAVERKQVENKLRESEGRFRIGLENAQVTVFTLDRDLRYTWISNSVYGLTPEQLIGRRDEDLLAPDEAAEMTALKRQVLQTGNRIQKELQFKNKDLSFRFLVTCEPLRDERGAVTGIRGAGVDMTQLRRLEAQRSEQTTRMQVQSLLLEQREQERQQIARDLHDGPVQDLISLIFTLQAAIQLAPPGELRELLESLRERTKQLTNELRTVCNDLRPPTLMKFGLEHAIRSHANEFAQHHPTPRIQLQFHTENLSLAEPVRIALFRIYQEGLFNAVRHSQANSVTVRINCSDRLVTLEIEDDGQGFAQPDDWLDLANRGHLGLLGMRERAKAIGGSLEITSLPGQGTLVRVTVPLDGKKNPGSR